MLQFPRNVVEKQYETGSLEKGACWPIPPRPFLAQANLLRAGSSRAAAAQGLEEVDLLAAPLTPRTWGSPRLRSGSESRIPGP